MYNIFCDHENSIRLVAYDNWMMINPIHKHLILLDFGRPLSDVSVGSNSVRALCHCTCVRTQQRQYVNVVRFQNSPFPNIPKVDSKTFPNISEINCISPLSYLSKIGSIHSFPNVPKVCTEVPFSDVSEVGTKAPSPYTSKIHRRSFVVGTLKVTRCSFQQIIVHIMEVVYARFLLVFPPVLVRGCYLITFSYVAIFHRILYRTMP